jgi:hypothetical protein
MCKDKDQQGVTIEELVCDNRRIAMICSCTLVYPTPKNWKIKIMDFFIWKLIFSLKEWWMEHWAFVSCKSILPSKVHQLMKAKDEKCITYVT